MALQNFYQLLSVEPTATAEDIKKAFRGEIARYHPDKVQHLGKEFQDMAATRAAQLTEAYRTLMNAELRSEYDRLYVGNATASPSASPPSSSASSASPPPASAASSSASESASGGASSDGQAPGQMPPRPSAPPPPGDPAAQRPSRFASERRDRDDFVRKATLKKLRQALTAEVGQFDESPSKCFDLDCLSKAKGLFLRNGAQRFAMKFVPRVDRAAVQEAWVAASAQKGPPVCVFLMGNGVAPTAELSDAIADMRKKSRGATGITIIPVDVRDWSAHVPSDAPAPCKRILQRLRDAPS